MAPRRYFVPRIPGDTDDCATQSTIPSVARPSVVQSHGARSHVTDPPARRSGFQVPATQTAVSRAPVVQHSEFQVPAPPTAGLREPVANAARLRAPAPPTSVARAPMARFKSPVIPPPAAETAVSQAPAAETAVSQAPAAQPSGVSRTSESYRVALARARDRKRTEEREEREKRYDARMEALSITSGLPLIEIHRVYQAAKNGDASAQFKLSSIFGSGIGVVDGISENYEKYLRLAAEAGLVDAEYTLGSWLLRQNREDFGPAAQWFSKAAMKGHTKATYNLAVLIAEGPKRETERALMLLKRCDKRELVENGRDIEDTLRRYEKRRVLQEKEKRLATLKKFNECLAQEKEEEREAARTLTTLCSPPPSEDDAADTEDDAADFEEDDADERAARSLVDIAKRAKPIQNTGRWSEVEHIRFEAALKDHKGDFGSIAKIVGTRTPEQCRSHNQKFSKKRAGDGSPERSPKKPRPRRNQG